MAVVVMLSVVLSGGAAALSHPRSLEERPPAHPWFDMSLPRAQRVGALVGAMTLEEKVAQLVVDTPKIERLGVPAYHWRNNILHGTVDNGVSTQFPQSIGMAASWDVPSLNGAARIMSDEQRAKHNIKIAETGGDSVMDYGLDLWGPNINSTHAKSALILMPDR
jgi:beta-glucosidase